MFNSCRLQTYSTYSGGEIEVLRKNYVNGIAADEQAPCFAKSSSVLTALG